MTLRVALGSPKTSSNPVDVKKKTLIMGEANSVTVTYGKKSVLSAMIGMRRTKASMVIVMAPSTCSIVITHVASHYGEVVGIVKYPPILFKSNSM
jgi:hypothetical protein